MAASFDQKKSQQLDAIVWQLEETRPAFWRRVALRCRRRWLERGVPSFGKRGRA